MNYTIGLLAIIAAHICATVAGPSPCACTRNLRPVCGSNGVTYNNECLLGCERSKSNSDLTVAREGECEDPAQPDICICTFEYKPVCGSDGTTYPNKCSLNCRQSAAPSLRVVHDGQCMKEQVKVAASPCMCTREMKQVCGSDGNTYNNRCLLDCAMQTVHDLRMEHAGPCEDRVRVVEQPQIESGPSCACARNLEPVCASDGGTYSNECMMRCRGGKGVTVVKHEPCDY